MEESSQKPILSAGEQGETRSPCSSGAFSLIELLVVLAVTGILAAAVLPALSGSLIRARNVQCLSKMKALGSAVLLYANDNSGEFPRSLHSCAGAGKPEWSRALLPYLALPSQPENAEADYRTFNTAFRCPSDRQRDSYVWSYAINVHFELDPDGDDYAGAPATWNRLHAISNPGATVLLAEPRGNAGGDHLMCHQWSGQTGARNALDSMRHGKTSNYLFVDGHVAALPLEATFHPAAGINLWNPSLAK